MLSEERLGFFEGVTMIFDPLKIELPCPRIYETATGIWEESGIPDHCAGCGGNRWEHVAEVNARIREREIREELNIDD